MEIIIETAGEETEQSDILELVGESWLKLGIKIHTSRPSARCCATACSPATP